MSTSQDDWKSLAAEQGARNVRLAAEISRLEFDRAALKDERDNLLRLSEAQGRQSTRLLEQAEMLIADRGRFIEVIHEFVEADAELERHMADANLEDALKRTPAFDRYDAAVAALKEAVK